MVGDLVDDQIEDIGSIVEPVSRFSAPDGKFFAMGEGSIMRTASTTIAPIIKCDTPVRLLLQRGV